MALLLSSDNLDQTPLISAYPFTYACWVQPSATISANACAMSMSSTSGTENFFALTASASGKMRGFAQTGSGTNSVSASTATVTAGVFHHCVSVFTSATNVLCYLDGVVATAGTTSIAFSGVSKMTLGCLYLNTATPTQFWNGTIAYPAFWNSALSPTDVASLHNNGAGVDPSTIQSASLVSFSKLQSGPPYLDTGAGTTWSVTGNPTIVADPFVLGSSNKILVFYQSGISARPPSIAANASFIDRLPFNGIVVNTPDSFSLLAPGNVSTFSGIYTSWLAQMVGVLKNVTHNYYLISGQIQADPFDDYTATIANWVVAAQSAKAAGFEGLWFDAEGGAGANWLYSTGAKYSSTKTLAQYQAQYQLVGAQIMSAVVAQWPACRMVHLMGAYFSESRTPSSVTLSNGNGLNDDLRGDLFSGMFAAAPGQVIDGGEVYAYRTSADFSGSYTWRKTSQPQLTSNVVIPSSISALWQAEMSISYGCYDVAWPVGLTMSASILQSDITLALANCDYLTWAYTDAYQYLTPAASNGLPVPPAGYVQAISNALATVSPPLMRDLRFGFATHFEQGWSTGLMPLIAATGVGYIRDDLLTSRWEPTVGNFVIPAADKTWIDSAHANGLLVVGIIGRNDTYVPNFSTDPYDPQLMANRAAFIAASGLIDVIEITNEPNVNFLQIEGAATWEAKLAALTTACTNAVHAANPNVTVIGLGAQGNQIISILGSTTVDGIVYHPYDNDNGTVGTFIPETVYEFQFTNYEGWLGNIMAATPLPLWETEWGAATVTGFSPDNQACFLVRRMLIAMGLGVDHSFIYEFKDNNSSDLFGVYDLSSVAKSSYAVITRLISALQGVAGDKSGAIPASSGFVNRTHGVTFNSVANGNTGQAYGYILQGSQGSNKTVVATWLGNASPTNPPAATTASISFIPNRPFAVSASNVFNPFTGTSVPLSTYTTSISGATLTVSNIPISDHPLLITLMATNYYVVPGGTGAKNGTGWNNAWDIGGVNWSTPNAGDTVWVAGGNYSGSIVIPQGTTGGNSGSPITVSAVLTSDAVASGTGWLASYAVTATKISMGPGISIPYPSSWWVFNGRIRSTYDGGGGVLPSCGWEIHIPSTGDDGIVLGQGNGGGGQAMANISFYFIACIGPQPHPVSSSSLNWGAIHNWALDASGSTFTNILFNNCVARGGTEIVHASGWTGVTVEYCYIADSIFAAGDHDDIMYYYAPMTSVWRYNTFAGSYVDGFLGGDDTGTLKNFYFYGNLVYNYSSAWCIVVKTGSSYGPVFIYNNTFAFGYNTSGVQSGSTPAIDFGGGGSGSASLGQSYVYNNLFYGGFVNNVSNSGSPIPISDYNAYGGPVSTKPGTDGAHSITLSAMPFVAAVVYNDTGTKNQPAIAPWGASGDFHPTTAGKAALAHGLSTLPNSNSFITTDMDGNARGSSGAWIIGAYDVAGSAGTAPTVTASAATSVTPVCATLNGSITSFGSSAVTSDGFDYGTTTGYGTSISGITVQSGAISAILTGLAAGTLYHYRAKATNSIGQGASSDATFTTQQAHIPSGDQRFGFATHFSLGWNASTTMPLIAATGVGWIRDNLDVAQWEPTKGTLAVSAFDTVWCNAAHAAGLQVVGILSSNAQYADVYDPTDMANRAALIAQSGLVDIIEVTDEPNNDYASKEGGTSGAWKTTLAATTSQVTNAVRSVSSTVQVIGLGGQGDQITFMTSLATAIDGVVAHPYDLGDQNPDNTLEPFTGSANQKYTTWVTFLRGRTSLPYWETAWGVATGATFSQDDQASYIARRMLTAMGIGVDHTFVYEFLDTGVETFGVASTSLVTKTAYNTITNIISALQGVSGAPSSPVTISNVGNGDTTDAIAYAFQGSNKTAVGYWFGNHPPQTPPTSSSVTLQFSVPHGFNSGSVIDAVGGTSALVSSFSTSTSGNLLTISGLPISDHPQLIVLSQSQGPDFVQVNSATPQVASTTVFVTFTGAQGALNGNVVVVGFSDITTTISSVTDTSGNQYVVANALTRGPSTGPGLSQAIYVAHNIVSAAAGSNTVKVTFSTAAAFPDVRILEYSGLTTAPVLVDVTSSASGTGTAMSSGSITTTVANDMLIAANTVADGTTGIGSGFTQRVFTPDGDIVMDDLATTIGSYTGTATSTNSNNWVMQIVALKALPVVGTMGFSEYEIVSVKAPYTATFSLASTGAAWAAGVGTWYSSATNVRPLPTAVSSSGVIAPATRHRVTPASTSASTAIGVTVVVESSVLASSISAAAYTARKVVRPIQGPTGDAFSSSSLSVVFHLMDRPLGATPQDSISGSSALVSFRRSIGIKPVSITVSSGIVNYEKVSEPLAHSVSNSSEIVRTKAQYAPLVPVSTSSSGSVSNRNFFRGRAVPVSSSSAIVRDEGPLIFRPFPILASSSIGSAVVRLRPHPGVNSLSHITLFATMMDVVSSPNIAASSSKTVTTRLIVRENATNPSSTSRTSASFRILERPSLSVASSTSAVANPHGSVQRVSVLSASTSSSASIIEKIISVTTLSASSATASSSQIVRPSPVHASDSSGVVVLAVIIPPVTSSSSSIALVKVRVQSRPAPGPTSASSAIQAGKQVAEILSRAASTSSLVPNRHIQFRSTINPFSGSSAIARTETGSTYRPLTVLSSSSGALIQLGLVIPINVASGSLSLVTKPVNEPIVSTSSSVSNVVLRRLSRPSPRIPSVTSVLVTYPEETKTPCSSRSFASYTPRIRISVIVASSSACLIFVKSCLELFPSQLSTSITSITPVIGSFVTGRSVSSGSSLTRKIGWRGAQVASLSQAVANIRLLAKPSSNVISSSSSLVAANKRLIAVPPISASSSAFVVPETGSTFRPVPRGTSTSSEQISITLIIFVPTTGSVTSTAVLDLFREGVGQSSASASLIVMRPSLRRVTASTSNSTSSYSLRRVQQPVTQCSSSSVSVVAQKGIYRPRAAILSSSASAITPLLEVLRVAARGFSITVAAVKSESVSTVLHIGTAVRSSSSALCNVEKRKRFSAVCESDSNSRTVSEAVATQEPVIMESDTDVGVSVEVSFAILAAFYPMGFSETGANTTIRTLLPFSEGSINSAPLEVVVIDNFPFLNPSPSNPYLGVGDSGPDDA